MMLKGLAHRGFVRMHPDMKTRTKKQRQAATQYHYLKADETKDSRQLTHIRRQLQTDTTSDPESPTRRRRRQRMIEDGDAKGQGAIDNQKKADGNGTDGGEEEKKKKAEKEKKRTPRRPIKRKRISRRRRRQKRSANSGKKILWNVAAYSSRRSRAR